MPVVFNGGERIGKVLRKSPRFALCTAEPDKAIFLQHWVPDSDDVAVSWWIPPTRFWGNTISHASSIDRWEATSTSISSSATMWSYKYWVPCLEMWNGVVDRHEVQLQQVFEVVASRSYGLYLWY